MSVTIFAGNSEINLSNCNFAALIRELGIYNRFPDLCGSISAVELRDLCQAWQQELKFDAGVEPSKDGNMFDCGRQRGYLNMRVQQVLELAEAAVIGCDEVSFG
jgi:hypothetical protein